MKHTCRTCDGTKFLEDGKPCPDCMLEVINSIKTCNTCNYKMVFLQEGTHCKLNRKDIEENQDACNFYKPKIN